jgi:hypothetical protein
MNKENEQPLHSNMALAMDDGVGQVEQTISMSQHFIPQ